MKLSDIVTSKYLSKEDCGEEGIILTIDRVEWEKVGENQSGKDEHKAVAHFREDVKPLILNVTNFEAITEGLGIEDSDDWGGQRIKAYNDPNVSFAGKRTGGIRVRTPKKSAPPPVAEQPVRSSDVSEEDIPF